jgi:RNA polymerase sigma-70 factor (ECF subfamily)
VDEPSFEQLVAAHYEPLYRFALSLTRREADACDITQQTFFRWATKGGQLRDKSKARSWLLTTLHREFLAMRRREGRFPHFEIDSLQEEELVAPPQSAANKMDGDSLMDALMLIDELYRAPLVLFYLEQNSYREIAAILEIPAGTVMSRLSRGKEMLRRALSMKDRPQTIIRLDLKKEHGAS